ncbi:MAG: HEPN domain-containing protein [Nitrospinota bacterium]
MVFLLFAVGEGVFLGGGGTSENSVGSRQSLRDMDMKQEAKRWMQHASNDLNTAKYLFRGRKYKEASFFCQQCGEKALKAVTLTRKGEIRKIHDLVELGKEAHLPPELLEDAKELTLSYIYARYPDVVRVRNFKKISSKFIEVAGEILKWARKQL